MSALARCSIGSSRPHRAAPAGAVLCALAVALLLPVSAAAGHIGFTIGSDEGTTMSLTESDLNCTQSGDTYSCDDDGDTLESDTWLVDSWSITLEENPRVSLNTSLTNTGSSTQTFTFSTDLPVDVSFGPPSFIKGSVDGGVTDADGELESTGQWATLDAPSGESIYTALIDGSEVRSLLPDSQDPPPFHVTSEFGSTGVGPADFGIPDAESVNVATTSDIGLRLRFTLTPGDSASFTSVFNVEPVPEPTTAALFGVGLAGLGLAARRRPGT